MWTLIVCFGISFVGCNSIQSYKGFETISTCQMAVLSATNNHQAKKVIAYCVPEK